MTVTSPPLPPRARRIRAYVAAASGTALEWYDFSIYSSSAALVFNVLFFTKEDPFTGTLLAFSTYAVGYAARPIGGFIFGHLGDVIGRKRVLTLTLLLMGIATVLIGVLPTYGQIGPMAAVLLVLLRLFQGIGIGGEWGGAILMASENASDRQRGFWSSAAQIGPALGTLIASGVFALMSSVLPDDQFLSWGWRIGFLLSAVLVAVGLWIRLRLEETATFQAIEAKGERAKNPIGEVFRHHWRDLIVAILARFAPDIQFNLFAVFVLTYITQALGMPREWGLAAVAIGSAMQVVIIPLFAALSDRIDRKRMQLIGGIAGAIYPFLFFPLISTKSFGALIAATLIALLIHASLYGPQAAYVGEQFPPRLRYAGSSLANTLGGLIGGAIAPLIFTALMGTGSWLWIAIYVAAAGVLSIIGFALGRRPNAYATPLAARAQEPAIVPTTPSV